MAFKASIPGLQVETYSAYTKLSIEDKEVHLIDSEVEALIEILGTAKYLIENGYSQ